MKLKHKLISAAFAAATLLGTGGASAAIVGNVDFGPFADHLETTTLAETYTDGNGQVVQGYGQVNSVNGDTTYTTDGSTLYFKFAYTTQNFTGLAVELINGTVDLYKGTLPNLLTQSSATNLAQMILLDPWVRLVGHGNLGGGAAANAEVAATGVFTGASLSFTGAGLLDVDTSGAFGDPLVAAFLDGNGLPDAIGNLADIAFTTSGNNRVLNRFDNTTGCLTGEAAVGQFCYQGSADLRGPLAVPEPGSLALLGAGLLGLVGVGAKKRRKS